MMSDIHAAATGSSVVMQQLDVQSGLSASKALLVCLIPRQFPPADLEHARYVKYDPKLTLGECACVLQCPMIRIRNSFILYSSHY